MSPCSTSPSRRRFLRSAGAAALGAGALPNLLLAQKTDSARPVVGSGDYAYECRHDWGLDSLPQGHHYGGATHGVAVDRQGLLYVTHHGGPASIFVFDPDGKFVRALGAGDFSVTNPKTKKAECFGHGIDIRCQAVTQHFVTISKPAPLWADPCRAFDEIGGSAGWRWRRTSD